MSSAGGVLNGKVAIVTGAGGMGNIGAQTARLLAESGARVVLADLDGSALEATTAALSAAGLGVACHSNDISNEGSVEPLIASAREKFGRLDILDNTAASQGQPEDAEVPSLSVELWD